MITYTSTAAIDRRARQMRAEVLAGMMRGLWARLGMRGHLARHSRSALPARHA